MKCEPITNSKKLDVDPQRDDDASPMSSYRCMLRPTWMFPYEDSRIVFVCPYPEKRYLPRFINISLSVGSKWYITGKVFTSTSYSIETHKFDFRFKKVLNWILTCTDNWIAKNHPIAVNISPSVVIDTWIERFLYYSVDSQNFDFLLKITWLASWVSAVMFCKQFLAYTVHIDWCYHSINTFMYLLTYTCLN